MTKTKSNGVPVSLRAAVARINRALDGEKLKAARGARARQDLGEYWILDVEHNAVAEKDVDVEQLGRKLGVLQPWETVVA